MRFNEAVELPEQCRDCPMMAKIGSIYNQAEQEKIDLLDFSKRNHHQIVLEIANRHDVSVEEAEAILDENNERLREGIVANYDQLVQLQEQNVGIAHSTLLLCGSGVLRLIGMQDDVRAEAVICMSEPVSMAGSVVGLELAKVRRKRFPGN